MRSASRTRGMIFALIAVIGALALLEMSARLLEHALVTRSEATLRQPGWQTEFFGSLFDWHEPDPRLLWRFKAGLRNQLITTNAEHFLGDDIPKEKGPDDYRILILGDSSPVGLGLKSRRQTFGELLRYTLEKYWNERKKVEVINAAVSGYSSEQIVRQLKLTDWDYHPDIVILYCGNNDASISGHYSDRKLLESEKFIGVRSLLSRFALYRVLRNLLVKRPDESAASDRLVVRVSPQQFGENLQSMIEQCGKHHTPLIICKPPVPLLWPAGLQFKPFLHIDAGNGELLLPPQMASILGRNLAYCLDEHLLRDIYGRFDPFTGQVVRSAYAQVDQPQDAVDRLTDSLARDSADPVLYNNLAVAYWRLRRNRTADSLFHVARKLFVNQHPLSSRPAMAAAGSPFLYNIGIDLLTADTAGGLTGCVPAGPARVYLDSALQADYFSLRIKRPYWEEIDHFVGAPWVSVIDLPKLFCQNGGEKLFIDHCHPTAEGHLLIARAIFDTLRTRQW
jgi:lysophospholipase L1-like esterase